jgi:hypothetical protein
MLNEGHHSNSLSVTVDDVLAGFGKQKSSKTPGLDRYIDIGLLIHSGVRLGVHLALLFNCSICRSYSHTTFMDSIIVPHIENEHDYDTNVDNYIAIMYLNYLKILF